MTSGTFSLLKLGSIIDDNGFQQMGTDTLADNVSLAEKIDATVFLFSLSSLHSHRQET